ncbi:MAG TPA: hypothetical protein VJ302_28115 [Blastocatellia bacterium]|nr:hypothetical protein [Blastocatellia bacterium]
MKCREVRRLFKYTAPQESESRREALAHTAECEKCRQGLVLDHLSSVLLEAHRARPVPEMPENLLMARIRARIRELGEQGMGSWETAVLALRGWVIALGAAALLLLTISYQWQLPRAANPGEHDSDVTSLSSIGDDVLSGNYTPSNNHTSEVGGNAHE